MRIRGCCNHGEATRHFGARRQGAASKMKLEAEKEANTTKVMDYNLTLMNYDRHLEIDYSKDMNIVYEVNLDILDFHDYVNHMVAHKCES